MRTIEEVKKDEEVMDWDHPYEEESDPVFIKGPLFSKLPPPPRFPGGGK